MSDDQYVTRHTLLQRAANKDDDQAWEEFVRYYKKFIYHILHKMNMNMNDFDDLVQDVLIKLWRGLPSYDKDKSKFRTWLSHVTRNAVLNYYRAVATRPSDVSMDADAIDAKAFLNSMSDSELEDMFESEWRAYLCTMAFENIKDLFSGQATDAFTMSQEGKSAEEIGEALGLKKESVYVLTSRVKTKFVNEVRRLIRELEF